MAITFKVGFQADVKDLQNSLQSIQKDISNAFSTKTPLSTELVNATKQAMALEQALKRATAENGDVSYSRFNTELKKAGTTASQLTTTLARGGSNFTDSLNAANRALATSNRSAITLSTQMKEVARVFTQSFKFTAAQTAIREITGSIQSAVIWVKELDTSITNIGVVTGKTASQLDKITEQVLSGSKELKVAAKEYAEGALIFYQQGLNDTEVIRRNEITIKAAKAAGQSVEQMSSQLTAIWNTYGMVGDEQLRAASVGAKMAAQTAVDFADIAEAMQTAAAPAAQMGVEYNQLAAIIATVGDVSQQSASTIGNAFKTIFSRFQQLKSAGTDGEVTLTSVSTQLQNLGINVIDASGNLRDLGDVINEVGQNWDQWTQTQQTAIAQIVGGARQYGQFLTLMQNFDKYQENLAGADSETGSTLEQQYSKAIDSIEAKAEHASEAWRSAFGSLIDEKALKAMYDSVAAIGEGVESLLDGFGGLPGILTLVASLLSSKIGPKIYEIGVSVQNTLLSLTKASRQYTINRDYSKNDAAITAQQKEIIRAGTDENGVLSDSAKVDIQNLEIQRKKNEFMKQVALTNEDINNKLKTASGEYRIQLEMQQKLAQAAGDQYQKHLDDLEILKQQLGAQQQALQLEESRIRVSAAKEVGSAQREVNKQTQAKNDAHAAGDTAAEAEATERLAEANARLSDARARYNEVLNSGELAQKQAEIHTANAAQALLELRTTTDRTSEGYDALATRINTEVTGALTGMNNTLRELELTEDGGGEAAQLLKSKIEALENSLKELKTMDDTALDGFIEDLREGASLAGQLSDKTNQLLSSAVQTGQNGQAAKDRLERSQNVPPPSGNNSAGFDGKKMVQGLTNIATSAMTVYSSINLASTAIENMGDKPLQSIIQLTAAASMGIPAFIKLGQSLIQVGQQLVQLIAMNPALAAIVAVIAAIAAVSAFFYNEWKNNTPEGQLKKSEEAAEALTESLEETKQAAEELRQTFDNYTTARAALDDCIKGTEEWREALLASNNAALELINSLDGLSGEQIKNLYEMKDGVIEINEEQMKMLQQQKDAQVNSAQYAAMMADNQVAQNKNRVMAKNIGRDYNNRYGQQTANTVASAGTMALTGAATGAIIGSVVPVVGTAIGAAVGAAIGGIGGLIGGVALADVANGNQNQVLGDKLLENLDSLRGKTGEELEQALKDIGISAKVGTDEFNSLSKSIEELAASTDAASEQMRLISKTAVENALGSAYSDAEKAIVAEKLDDKEKAIYDSLIQEMKDNFAKIDDGSKEDRDAILDRLAAATGKTYSAQSNFSRGTDSNRSFGVYEDGEEKVYTMEYIASTIAAAEALEGLQVEAQAAREALEGMSNAEKDFIATRSLGGATKSEFDEVIAAASGEDGELTQESAQAYFERIGLSSEDAAAYARDLLASAEIPWDDLIEGLPEALEGAENLTADAAKAIGEQYKKILGDVGQEGADLFTETINGLTEGLDAEKQKDVFAALMNIDWSNWDAGDQAVETLKGMNIEVDVASKEWKDFISVMRDANNAIVDVAGDLKKMEEALSSVSDIDYGDIIDEEDYNNLKAYNTELAKYFTLLADGSAQFTGDKLDFIQATQTSRENTYLDLVKQVKENRDELDAQLKEGEKILNGSKVSDIGISMADSAGEGKYYTSNVQQQLDFLSSQGYDEEQLQKWTDTLIDANGEWQTVSTTTLSEIGEAVASLNGSFEAGPEMISNYNDQIQGLYMSYGLMAETMKEAEELANKALENEGLSKDSTAGAELYDSVINAGFENRKNTEKWAEMDPEEVQAYSDHLQSLTQSMKKAGKESDMLSNDLADNAEAAEDVALYTEKMNQGIDKLADGIEEWSDLLSNSTPESEEYAKAMIGLKDAMSDVLGVSEEFLSDEFIVKNMEDIKLAAEGDADAIDRLAVAAGRDIIMNLDLQDEGVLEKALTLHDELTAMIPDIKVGAVLEGTSDFAQKAMELLETTAMTADEANAYFRSIGFEPNFEMETVTQEVPGYKTVTVSDEPVWGWSTQMATNAQGEEFPVSQPYIKEQKSYQYQEAGEDIKQSFAVPKLTGEDGKPNANISFTRTNAGAMNNYSSANKGGSSPGSGSKSSGGGSSKSNGFKKKDDHKESDKIKERYTNIQSSIDKTARAIDRLASAEDDAWGAQKYKNLKLINQQLGVKAQKTQILLQQARDYLKVDQSDLQSILSQNGMIDALFNEDGFVMNRENIIAQLNAMQEPLDQAVQMAIDAYNAAGEAASEEVITSLEEQVTAAEEALSNFQDEIKQKVLDALEQVDETAQKVHDTMTELIESIREVMQNWVDMQQVKLDIHIAITDQDISTAEHLVDLWGEIGTRMGWTADKYHDIFNSNSEAYDATMENAKAMQNMIEGLRNGDNDAAAYLKEKFGEEAYNEWLNGNGKIPDVVMEQWEASVESLQDIRDNMQEALRNMMQEWINYLSLVMEDFDKLSERLSRNQETLDMWSKVLEGMGMDKTVDGAKAMAKIAKTTYDTSKKQAQVYRDQALTAKKANQDAKDALERFENSHMVNGVFDVSSLTENEIIQYQGFLDMVEESETAMYDAESNFKSAIEEMVDNMTAVMEAETERLRAEFFANNISDGAFFDWDSMLETYNGLEEIEDLTLSDLTKNYSLDSLGSEITTLMEDITSPEVLQYGSDLLDEINEKLASGEKITQEQLDGYQAQFEIMKAMAEYEDAQNNKNTMRLSRDASGNYSYIYSSDASAKEDKLQQLKDAIYEYERLQEEAIDKYEDAWIETYAKIGQLEEEKNTARYQNDEKYRAYIDEQLRQQYEMLDFYAEKTQLHYDQLYKIHEEAENQDSILFDAHVDHKITKFNEGNLSMTMGTEETFDTMTDFHEAFVNYMSGPGGYADQLETTGDEIVSNTLGDVEEVGEGLEIMEGDYTDLASLVEDKAEDIEQDNDDIAQSSTDLRDTATSAFDDLTRNIENNSNSMVTKLNAVTEAIYDQIEALQKLRREQLAEMEADDDENDPWDPSDEEVDNYVPPDSGGSTTVSEDPGSGGGLPSLSRAEEVYKLINTGKLGNGINPTRINEAAKLGYTKQELYLGQALINARYPTNLGGKGLGWTQAAIDWATSTGYQTLVNKFGAYTGGLFDRPMVTEIAEKGPELVLNADDTKNILAAVSMMRQTVASQFGSINGSLLGSANSIANSAISIAAGGQALDQQVHIEASFPGVSVAQEIEDALNSLITQAAQYNIKK